ncbi:MAG: hypothetical protein MHM6MM_002068 [Cercozoa sp. M6MM]
MKREREVREGRLLTIIFVRTHLQPKQASPTEKGEEAVSGSEKPHKEIEETGNVSEVSAYIDFAQRLATDNFEDYFAGKRKLQPRPSDLSYFAHQSCRVSSSNTQNFSVELSSEVEMYDGVRRRQGIVFKNLRSRKYVFVDEDLGEIDTRGGAVRVDIADDAYDQVVLFDVKCR